MQGELHIFLESIFHGVLYILHKESIFTVLWKFSALFSAASEYVDVFMT